MVFFPLLFLFIPCFFSLHLLSFLQPYADAFHQVCLSRIPSSSYSLIYGAMVCAEKISYQDSMGILFKKMGLIHLLVVSGAHLFIIYRLLLFLVGRHKRFTVCIFLLLLLYLFVCRFEAPVVRGFFGIVVTKWNERYHLFWNRSQCVLFSGLLCLVFFPSWLLSLSFQLCWAAGFLNCWPVRGMKKALLFYFGLLPMLLPLGIHHPLGMMSSYFFSYVVFIPMFVISVLVVCFPQGVEVFHFLMKFILRFMESCSEWIPPPLDKIKGYEWPWIWIWLMILFMITFWIEVISLRRKW